MRICNGSCLLLDKPLYTLIHVDNTKDLFDKKMPFFCCCLVLSADLIFTFF